MRLLIFRRRKSAAYQAAIRILACFSFSMSVVGAVPQVFGEQEREMNGFYGIPWGARLDDVAGLRLIESGDRVQTYEPTTGPPQLGDTKVDLMRLVTIEGQFARVSIHYSGEQNHSHMLSYLQSQFGPIAPAPGSMIRGLTQQFTWRTDHTEVNLTYRSYQQRGTVFIESRTLAPRFNDDLTDDGY